MASPPEEAAALSMFFQVIADERITNYMAAAALTVLVRLLLDHRQGGNTLPSWPPQHLTTDQVELIWKRPKQMAANLFLLNRYFTILAISAHVTFMFREVKSDNLELSSSIVITPVVDFVLFLRVWALYSKSKTLLYCLLPVIFVEPIIMIVLCCKVVSSIKIENGFLHAGDVVKGCYPLNYSERTSYSAMVYTPLAISTVMFFLTMYKCGSQRYERRSGGATRVRTPILSLFIRDGVYWFIAVLALFITQIVIAAVARVTLGEMLIKYDTLSLLAIDEETLTMLQ
ncbi:hypothetical protein VNI00_011429 [Paramarasmius palmivorus]|uniref:Uncharacterized protein n=1 Tax=Paramarasmius palmivorus TaxID=297713 RepID=A0AAW0CDM8_9AGAR